MKKLLIAAITLTGFSISGIAQTTAAAKPASSKIQVVKQTPGKQSTGAVTMKKTVPAVSHPAKPATTTSSANVTKAAVTTKIKTPENKSKPGKQAIKVAAAPGATVHVKKDGTPDKRFKENKKHS
jgi:hypothetical protein